MNVKKYAPLAVVLIVIAGTIWYLEKQKPQRVPVESSPLGRIESSNAPTVPNVSAPQDRTSLLKQKAAAFPSGQELADMQGYNNTDKFKLAE